MSTSLPGYRVKECKMPSAGTGKLSAVADLELFKNVALSIPALNDTPDLTFTASRDDDTTFVSVNEDDGSTPAISIKGGATAFIVASDELRQLGALRFVKIVSSVAQTSDRTFYWILSD